MSAGYFPKREKVGLEDLFKGLVTASHILHCHDVLDAYGHISVRSPDNPATFWMPCSMPPALVSSADDLVEYHIESAEAVEKNAKPGYIERHIHSEIYKRFPGINSVVHSHAGDVLPYCISGVPLKNTIHMAGFLGTNVPVWNSSGSDFLVRDSTLGASLAASFKPATSAGFIYSKVRSALPGAKPEASLEPDSSVVLLQGHGFTTLAHGIEEAVYQAIYTKEAAKAQTTALAIQNAYFGHTLEGKIDIEAGGKIKSGKAKGEGDLKYLTEKQAHATWEAMQATTSRPWALWCREVEISPLYRNECPSGED
ncbi:arad-like aldolase/epimerase [Lizonia empirigonia]|nr:arad-like aldolase/epimerase [Lizonia empirigonia]